MTDGRTVLEINPSGAAALETEALWLLVRKKAGELAKVSELANTQRRVKAHA